MQAPSTVRILILAHDHTAATRCAPLLERAGLAPALRTVGSEHEFTRALGDFAPDLVLANHAGDAFDAMAALRTLQNGRPGTPLIVLVDQVDEGAAVDVLRRGAEDIVSTARLERLPDAVQAALTVRRRLALLSPRQLEVLQGVAQGLTTREISRRMKISVKTVETHRSALMKRLDMHEVATLVRYAVRVGLVPAQE